MCTTIVEDYNWSIGFFDLIRGLYEQTKGFFDFQMFLVAKFCMKLPKTDDDDAVHDRSSFNVDAVPNIAHPS